MNQIITSLATATVDPVPGGNTFKNDVIEIINAIIAVLGLACVVVMVIGGVNFMTSAGDTGKVKRAKDTILYGLIGLIVCVLSFAIVNFLISDIIDGDSDESAYAPALIQNDVAILEK